MKIMWSERIGNELYVYWRGRLIYKKWYKPKQPSRLFNEQWPSVEIINKENSSYER